MSGDPSVYEEWRTHPVTEELREGVAKRRAHAMEALLSVALTSEDPKVLTEAYAVRALDQLHRTLKDGKL